MLTLSQCRDHYTPVTDDHIPTGDLDPVKGTPFDFVEAKKIGSDITEVYRWPVYAIGMASANCMACM